MRAPGSHRRARHGDPWRKLTREMELCLFHDVLDSPTSKLSERALMLELEYGVRVSIPTICRAMQHMRLSCKRSVQHYALERDELRAAEFWRFVSTTYTMDRMSWSSSRPRVSMLSCVSKKDCSEFIGRARFAHATAPGADSWNADIRIGCMRLSRRAFSYSGRLFLYSRVSKIAFLFSRFQVRKRRVGPHPTPPPPVAHA